MAPKRVLFLSYNGALEPIFQSQGLPYLKRLARAGVFIVLLTFEKKEDLRRVDPTGLHAFQRGLEEEGIAWHWSRYHKWPPLLSTFFDATVGFVRGWFLGRRYAIDLIHVRGSIPAGFGWAVSRLLKKPFLFDVRGFLAEEYADGGIWRRGGMVFHLVSRLERFFLEAANGIVVLTHRAFSYLKQQRFAAKDVPIIVIPCCVDLQRFEIEKSQKDLSRRENFVLTYVGSLGTWYLLEPMLHFYQILKEKIPNASFHILTQTSSPALSGALRRFSNDGIVLRRVDYEEIPSALSSAKAGISFIKPVFSKMASSPVKVGEYLASGLPVILNPDVGDTETLIRENRVGIIVPHFDRDSYREAVEGLLELLKEGKELSERCRRVATSHLSLEEGAKRYHEMYEKLLTRVS